MQRVLHIASEAHPIIKTGGLADVASALPTAQIALGADARLLLPGYGPVLMQLREGGSTLQTVATIGPAFGAASIRLLGSTLPGSQLPIYLVDSPWHFARPGNPYVAQNGLPWSDNHLRFGLLAWIGAQIGAGQLVPHWQPDVVHAHDWHAGLAMSYLQNHPANRIRRIFTIHNLAFQGRFPLGFARDLAIPEHLLNPDALEFHGDLSFIKAGITCAHLITTVSPSYAQEILHPTFGEGLDGLLRQHRGRLTGILNGIDQHLWNPASDTALAHNYTDASLDQKQLNKGALQNELGLGPCTAGKEQPLFAVVSRLSRQKGLDLVVDAAGLLIKAGAQLVVLGSGDADLETAFASLANRYPNQVSLNTGFDEALAHRIIGGADAILVPSMFEPCGLTQLYGLRYGTVPVVRRVGGLADTVNTANGFVFDSASEFPATLAEVLKAFADKPRWQHLMLTGMQSDHQWAGPAQQYLDSYQ